MVRLVKCAVNLKPHGLTASFYVSYPQHLSKVENDLSTTWDTIGALLEPRVENLAHYSCMSCCPFKLSYAIS